MTPTEQDKELREAILLEFKNVHRLAPADYTENCTNIVMQLITADRKRVALEARIDENKTYWWHQQKRAASEGVSTHALERIDELKKELESYE